MVTYGLNDTSRMSREVHVRFSEGLRVKFPRPTQPLCWRCFPASEIDIFASIMSLVQSFFVTVFLDPIQLFPVSLGIIEVGGSFIDSFIC